MKTVEFSRHALIQMSERGANQHEVIETIRTGEKVPAKKGRRGYRKNFQYNADWAGRFFLTKQVLAIVVEECDRLVVITVYTFYF